MKFKIKALIRSGNWDWENLSRFNYPGTVKLSMRWHVFTIEL